MEGSLSPGRICLYVIAILALTLLGMAWHLSGSPAPREPHKQPFPEYKATGLSPLPKDIQDYVSGLCQNCKFSAPSEPCARTDVRFGDEPYRCVVSISKAGSEWTLTYDVGGFVTSRNVMVIETHPKVSLSINSTCFRGRASQCSW
jgi:hypothetical protein